MQYLICIFHIIAKILLEILIFVHKKRADCTVLRNLHVRLHFSFHPRMAPLQKQKQNAKIKAWIPSHTFRIPLLSHDYRKVQFAYEGNHQK